jgi:hypothetical protein
MVYSFACTVLYAKIQVSRVFEEPTERTHLVDIDTCASKILLARGKCRIQELIRGHHHEHLAQLTRMPLEDH